MAVVTSATTTLALTATVPGTDTFANFDAQTYTAVGEVTDLGEVGREYSTVNHSPLGSRRVQKLKGSYNSGALQIQMGRDANDAGQTLLTTALTSDNAYSFKIVLANGKKVYFRGLVMSYKTGIGGVDQVTGGTATVEIVSDIFEG